MLTWVHRLAWGRMDSPAEATCEHDWVASHRERSFILVERCRECQTLRERFDPPYVPDWAQPKVRLK